MAKKSPAGKSIYVRLANLIDEAGRGGRSRGQVFNDFITVAAIEFANPLSPVRDATWQAREDEYLKIFHSYKKPEILVKMFGELHKQFAQDFPHFTDILGSLFHYLNIQDEWIGQFFTPSALCEISAITFDTDTAKEIIDKRGYIGIHEPATGGSAMLLAIINRLIDAGINPSTQALFVANDIDIRCVHMSYIQLSLAGVPAIVNHRDTLLDKELSPPWYTPTFLFDGWAQRLDLERRINQMWDWLKAADAKEPRQPKSHFTKPATPDKPARPPEPKYEQLTLF